MTMICHTVLMFLASNWVATTGDIQSDITGAIINIVPPLPSREDRELLQESQFNMAEISREYGYECENFTVNTQDGFILDLYHLVREEESTNVKQPVLFMHGMAASSRIWLDAAQHSFPFYLFDKGYDIWLGNLRGNFYTKNTKYSRNDKQFWDFCIDDMAEKNIPPIIDAVLEKTGAKQLVYIGNSMGTTVGFAFLSSMKNYHSKIAGYIAVAPVFYMRYVSGFMRYLLAQGNLLGDVLGIAGVHQLFSIDPKAMKIVQYLCPARDTAICQFLATLMFGFDPYLTNETKAFVYTSHTYDGVATKLLQQYSQSYAKNGAYKYDYGRAKNLEIYHNETAPAYDLTKVMTPIVLIHGPNDVLGSPLDVCILKRKFPNIIGVKLLDFPMYAHLDMLFAVDNPKYYYEYAENSLINMFK